MLPSGHSAIQWPFFLQRKHLFSLRSRARGSFGVPSPSVEVKGTDGAAVVAAENPPHGFALLYERRRNRGLSVLLS